jgi:hypothetical protein
MKTIKTLISLVWLLSISNISKSQTINWNSLGHSKNIISAGLGWDYSVSYNLGYGYRLRTKTPILLNGNFIAPSGEKLMNDFKTKIGGQIIFFNKPKLKGSIALNGIFRRYENPLVRLQNFGSELKGTFGYYRPKYFIAVEVGFDKAIATKFEHSETFKETVFPEIKDGWYEPATGGNYQYGLQTGYSLNKSDITFNIGMVKTQDFKSTPLIPYYLMLGYNLRIK